VERTRWAVSLSLANPSGCENLRRRQVAEQRTITGPSPEYIKTQARPVQRVTRTHRGIQNSKRNARSSNGSHTRNGRPANHSSRRINSASGQAAPLAGEAGDASP
jgi:predicted NAD/FAD-binding protein